jgi:signal transduction histidine kinase
VTGNAPWVEVALGSGTAFFGGYEAVSHLHAEAHDALPRLAIGVVMGLAVGVSRRQPPLALALVWLVGGVQILSATDVMLVELAAAIVIFGASRYGSVATVWASGVSLPIAYLAGAVYVRAHGTELSALLGVSTLARLSPRPTLVLAATACVALAIPWLLGLTMRMRAQAKTSRQERVEADRLRAIAESRRAEAEELARVREDQARLARDVHDVVGHSLAVILAQAESAGYLPDSDPTRLKEVMSNIASSARSSLGDVRRVLSDPSAPFPHVAASIDSLIQRLEDAGTKVDRDVTGLPRPLPPDLAAVAYHVLQEMLTNALKHGLLTEPIAVAQDWSRGLRLEVRNVVGVAQPGTGQGLTGMRTRVASVHGSLTAQRADETFVATAWIPTGATADEPDSERQ